MGLYLRSYHLLCLFLWDPKYLPYNPKEIPIMRKIIPNVDEFFANK